MSTLTGVVGDTIVIVRKNKSIYTSRVDELLADCQQTESGPKFSGIELWSNDSFQPLENISKVESNEQIVRVLTNTGVIDCCLNYKLVRQKNKPASIGDLAPSKSRLAHQTDVSLLLKQYELLPDEVECPDAFALGAFASFGSCCTLSAESGAYWQIDHKDANFLTKVKQCLPFHTVVYDPVPPSDKYRLTLLCDERLPCGYYRSIFYNKHGDKRVPDFIMNASKAILTRFWAGFLPSGQPTIQHLKSHGTVIACGKQLAADMWLLAHRIGFHVVLYEHLSTVEADLTTFDLHCLWMKSKYDPTEVRYVYELSKSGEKRTVYRVKVANASMFSVAPGNLLISNATDNK